MVRKLAVLLLTVVVPPAVTLAWFGVRMLEQDRTMLAQRDVERRQSTLRSAALVLEQSFGRAERSLTSGRVPEGCVRLTATDADITAEPVDLLLWLPVARPLTSAAASPFAAAEQLEYQQSPTLALEAYSKLARSSDPAVRAGSLLRQARVYRRSRQWPRALELYKRLSDYSSVVIEGSPADLLARRAIGDVLAESGANAELERHAAQLRGEFLAGRWQVERAVWQLTANDLGKWTGKPPGSVEREQLSAAAEVLWAARSRSTTEPAAGRAVILAGSEPITVTWRRSSADVAWLLIPRRTLQAWLDDSGTMSDVGLLGESGQLVAGRDRAAGRDAIRLASSETGLPWTIAIAPRAAADQAAEFKQRRLFFATAVGAVLLLLAGSSYFLWRVLQRDIAVARLQTDFVATVSHEFRTPLASLRHLTELLEEGDDVPLEKRKAFYAALARNTERLQRLVESLLDFARIESRRKTYDLRPVDVGQLAGAVVADFRHTAPRHIDLAFDGQASGLQVRADVSSLANAIWNLLDNAVKYSPDGGTVAVALTSRGRHVSIEVRDSGMGIPAEEQREIFRKFVRGKTARALGIKGTGLGLALVTHIVRAHGGRVDVDSKQGVGSTFRITIPLHEEPIAADTRRDLGAFRTS